MYLAQRLVLRPADVETAAEAATMGERGEDGDPAASTGLVTESAREILLKKQ